MNKNIKIVGAIIVIAVVVLAAYFFLYPLMQQVNEGQNLVSDINNVDQGSSDVEQSISDLQSELSTDSTQEIPAP